MNCSFTFTLNIEADSMHEAREWVDQALPYFPICISRWTPGNKSVVSAAYITQTAEMSNQSILDLQELKRKKKEIQELADKYKIEVKFTKPL